MQNKEKIIQISIDADSYYCNSCKYNDKTYRNKFCNECHKYSNWALSPTTAEEIADKIIKLGEIYPISKEELKGAYK